MPPDFPEAPLAALDTVWFQVSGTVCNLACTHCFISCSPGNISHPLMTLEQVLPHLEEAARLGAKEYYFTGGEPLVNPALESILAAALRHGPCTVLTNGVLINSRRAAARHFGVSDSFAIKLMQGQRQIHAAL